VVDRPALDEHESLRVTRQGHVATLWLDRPAKRNAITDAMWRAIPGVLAALADDPDARVLVVRGAGDHFCAGADIGELATVDLRAYHAGNEAADRALAGFPKPTIAFIRGSCVGGGAEVAIACDLRIADTTARFGITPARLAILYPPFAVERVVRLVGAAAAKHLLFSAELIDAARAQRIGLVDEVHEPGDAEARLATLTTELAERSQLTQQAAKQWIDSVDEHGTIDPSLAARWYAELARSSDTAEGIAAFLERRPPRFSWTGPATGGP
jgi:enoyl-CoA hydratase/carnithine racemase